MYCIFYSKVLLNIEINHCKIDLFIIVNFFLNIYYT